MALTVPYLAEVQSDSDVEIASKVTSRVEMIVSSGTRVKRGEVIVRLGAAELLASQVIPRDKYDTEAANIESLQATIAGMQNRAASLEQNIREIEDSLTYTGIKAPMDGVVSKTYVAEGGIADGGKPLLSLAGGDGKRLVVRVPDDVKPTALLMKRADQPCPLLPFNSTFNGLDEYSCQMRTDLAAGNRVEVLLETTAIEQVLKPRAFQGRHEHHLYWC